LGPVSLENRIFYDRTSTPFHQPHTQVTNQAIKQKLEEEKTESSPISPARSPKGGKKKYLGQNEQPQEFIDDYTPDIPLPNFFSALFRTTEVDNDNTIANKAQYKEIEQIMEQFYNITSELMLDQNNDYIWLSNKAQELRTNTNKNSLTSVSACSDFVNRVLISQHEPWVQKQFSEFCSHQKENTYKNLVFKRLKKDEENRQLMEGVLEQIKAIEIEPKDFNNEREEMVGDENEDDEKAKTRKKHVPCLPMRLKKNFAGKPESLQQYLTLGGQLRDILFKDDLYGAVDAAIASFQTHFKVLIQIQEQLEKNYRLEYKSRKTLLHTCPLALLENQI
jgi:hypothetical protein